MKKTKNAFFVVLIFALAAVLSSCDVHVGSEHWDVEWYVITVPAVLVIALSLLISGKLISKFTYVCSHCGEKFSPTLIQACLSVHIGSSRLFKCPHCGARGFCDLSWRDN